MSKGNEIVLETLPYRGKLFEGTIKTALYPGTCVQIDTSEKENGQGRWQFEVYDQNVDGVRALVLVLLNQKLLGQLATTQYAAGAHCVVYAPLPGDELNMLVKNLAGTADDHVFGEKLMIDDATGMLVASTGTSVESEPFMLLEDITDPTADTLAHCIFTGY